ncbi:MAG: hypothetical protein OJF50_004999 [Nitrospira sp.]|nr:hypothetical protein [Nitrospira sp.]
MAINDYPSEEPGAEEVIQLMARRSVTVILNHNSVRLKQAP